MSTLLIQLYTLPYEHLINGQREIKTRMRARRVRFSWFRRRESVSRDFIVGRESPDLTRRYSDSRHHNLASYNRRD